MEIQMKVQVNSSLTAPGREGSRLRSTLIECYASNSGMVLPEGNNFNGLLLDKLYPGRDRASQLDLLGHLGDNYQEFKDLNLLLRYLRRRLDDELTRSSNPEVEVKECLKVVHQVAIAKAPALMTQEFVLDPEVERWTRNAFGSNMEVLRDLVLKMFSKWRPEIKDHFLRVFQRLVKEHHMFLSFTRYECQHDNNLVKKLAKKEFDKYEKTTEKWNCVNYLARLNN